MLFSFEQTWKVSIKKILEDLLCHLYFQDKHNLFISCSSAKNKFLSFFFFCFIERPLIKHVVKCKNVFCCITSYLIAVSERFENYKAVTFFNLHLVLVRKAGWPGDMTLLWSLRFHGDGKRWQKKIQRRIILNTSLRAA